jgi:hypothetical protein
LTGRATRSTLFLDRLAARVTGTDGERVDEVAEPVQVERPAQEVRSSQAQQVQRLPGEGLLAQHHQRHRAPVGGDVAQQVGNPFSILRLGKVD